MSAVALGGFSSSLLGSCDNISASLRATVTRQHSVEDGLPVLSDKEVCVKMPSVEKFEADKALIRCDDSHWDVQYPQANDSRIADNKPNPVSPDEAQRLTVTHNGNSISGADTV
jgi:hypothetical protein